MLMASRATRQVPGNAKKDYRRAGGANADVTWAVGPGYTLNMNWEF
jgi:hypothetical protein